MDRISNWPLPDETYYRQYVGCAKVVFFPQLPYEESQHIDVWAKFLSNNTILIHNLEDRTINTINPKYQSKAREIQTFLRARKTELESLGLTVKMIPMPAPYFDVGNVGTDYEYEVNSVLSFVNALAINGTLIVPDYLANFNTDGDEIPLSDISLYPEYKKTIEAIAASEGFSTVFVNSDNIVGLGGAIHCVTKESRYRLFGK